MLTKKETIFVLFAFVFLTMFAILGYTYIHNSSEIINLLKETRQQTLEMRGQCLRAEIIIPYLSIAYVSHFENLGFGSLIPSWLCIFCFFDKIKHGVSVE